MDDSSAALAVLTGLAVRLLIPILITGLAVIALGRLDRRWKTEGKATALKLAKPQCWKTKHCSPSSRKLCPACKSYLPCWQVFRLSNGYLAEKCLGCAVLLKAPVPAQA